MTLYESHPRKDLPLLPDFAQLSERVWRVMGLNPGKFTLQGGTNTYLVGTSNRKMLIDCGDGHPSYLPLLIKSLSKIDPEAYISDIIISHCHKDHWGGLSNIMSSELTNKRSITIHKFPLLEKSSFYKNLELFPEGREHVHLEDNQIIEVDKDTHLRVIHTPGHAYDHCSFYLEEENVVFTADCILGHGPVSFEDLTLFMKSLYKIRALNPAKLYPGHGATVDEALEKVDQYISQRLTKEKQIVDILREDIAVEWSAIELVDRMNNNESSEMHIDLIAIIVRTVVLHLIKLYHDGRVRLLDEKEFRRINRGLDPYNPDNAFSVVNLKWVYCADIKLNF
ncbi:Metallo-hydrolase/oxidoreductase [Backusella circina FSU 941]|nr:Metallo-hydrolase/oxidoreductase [Backusella circina FSU 941]